MNFAAIAAWLQARGESGRAVRILPAGRVSTVSRIVTMDGDLERAAAASRLPFCWRTKWTARAAT
jgi:sulfate adenylyltransferase subunit 1 (EFTu-like GTPase family)